jgi:hypothetical protein
MGDITGGLAKGFIAFMPARIIYDKIANVPDMRAALIIAVGVATVIYVGINVGKLIEQKTG